MGIMDLAKGIDGIGEAIFYNDHIWSFFVLFLLLFFCFHFLFLVFLIKIQKSSLKVWNKKWS